MPAAFHDWLAGQCYSQVRHNTTSQDFSISARNTEPHSQPAAAETRPNEISTLWCAARRIPAAQVQRSGPMPPGTTSAPTCLSDHGFQDAESSRAIWRPWSSSNGSHFAPAFLATAIISLHFPNHALSTLALTRLPHPAFDQWACVRTTLLSVTAELYKGRSASSHPHSLQPNIWLRRINPQAVTLETGAFCTPIAFTWMRWDAARFHCQQRLNPSSRTVL